MSRHRADLPRVVYFAKHNDRIKVGYTIDLDARLKSFKTTIPDIELVGWILGGREKEKSIHNHLAQYKIGGEWFHYTDEVKRIVDELVRYSPKDLPPKPIRYEPEAIKSSPEDSDGDGFDPLKRVQFETFWTSAVLLSRTIYAVVEPNIDQVKALPREIRDEIKDEYDGLKDAIELTVYEYWKDGFDPEATLAKLKARADRAWIRIQAILAENGITLNFSDIVNLARPSAKRSSESRAAG